VVYAKLKLALVGLLAIGSVALTAGGAIAKYVDLQNLRLPTPGDLGKWVKPLFRGFLPSLQASTAGDDGATSDRPAAPTDLEGPSAVLLPAPDPVPAPRRDRTLPSVPSRDERDDDAPGSDPPRLNALAQAILTPPVALPESSASSNAPDVQDRTTVGSDSANLPAAADEKKPSDEERVEPVLADAGNGEMHLGAGGGAAGGKVEEYVLPPNTTLNTTHQVVGDSGPALFRQNGGANRVEGTLTVGKHKGATGTYQMNDGTLTARSEVIGEEGTGVFIQYAGVNIAQDSMIVGKGAGSAKTGGGRSDNSIATSNNKSSNGGGGNGGSGGNTGGGSGTVASTSGSSAGGGSGAGGGGGSNGGDAWVSGTWASGTYQQFGGKTAVVNDNPTKNPSDDPNGLHLGENAGATGNYLLADGTLSADPQLIGKGGDGTLTQTGGKNTTGAVVVAADPGSTGSYNMSSGQLVVEPRDDDSTKPDVAIKIGGAGKGRFSFGGVNKTGSIYEVGGAGSSVVVRGEPAGEGVLTGYGPVNLTGALVNNGRIEADGFRQERDLDLSQFSFVTSSIENPRWGGASGWFARREGRLKLPAVPVQAGKGTYTWGEDAGDPMIDLVNSVRFTIRGAQQAGDVEIALNSPVRDDLPTLPEGHRFIGIWSFDGSSLGGFDAVELSIRYDDGLARTLGLDEGILKLWQYDQTLGAWQRINDASFSRNTLDHILSGTAGGDLSYFAVSAPEPGGAVLVALGAAALLRRRRR
jgi:MYXO-CTERM domain-containing protein